MKNLEFDIKNTMITRVAGDKTSLVSGAVNYFGIHINFDDEFNMLNGIKVVEFFKNRNKVRIELFNGSCMIPNEMLIDKVPFEMRVVSGGMVATPWISVQIAESGSIYPSIPNGEIEGVPDTMDYVRTLVGDETVSALRHSSNGLEYSQNGSDWISGINGVSDVPNNPKGQVYVRKNGDWIPYEDKTYNIEGMKGTAVSLEIIATDADLPTIAAKINEIIAILKDRGVVLFVA